MNDQERRVHLSRELNSVREFTCALYAPLAADQWRVPCRSELNLPLWELGHIAWFQEWWCLRFPHAGRRASALANADALYHSSAVAHSTRWTLPLLNLHQTLDYLDTTLARVGEKLTTVPTAQLYFWELALRHEAMHIEAGVMAAQLLATPNPFPACILAAGTAHAARDIAFGADRTRIGSCPSDTSPFVFDNEKWEHDVALPAFAMRSTLTSNGEYAAFLDATGHPMPEHWRRSGMHGYEVRAFDVWAPIRSNAAVCNVRALDAQAYCAWARRRLPTEFEWEHAVRTQPDAFADAFGVAWQWTASAFAPYPGFVADPYEDYSQPWFDGQHRTLRGSSFVTRSCLSHARFRNFYLPQRADVFAGFRTCPI